MQFSRTRLSVCRNIFRASFRFGIPFLNKKNPESIRSSGFVHTSSINETVLPGAQAPLFASHSLSLGHLLFARFPSQSPQIVMSWLQGTNRSGLVLTAFLFPPL